MKLTPRFQKALDFAFELHKKQTRKGSKAPYYCHLMAVCSVVIEKGKKEEEAIAAILHDGPEDQGGLDTLDKISKEFGEEVARIIKGCSEPLTRGKKKEIPWKERKKYYLENLEGADESIALVVMADKLHNIGSMIFDYKKQGDELWERFTGKKEGTHWYYREILKILKKKGYHPNLYQELEQRVRYFLRLSK